MIHRVFRAGMVLSVSVTDESVETNGTLRCYAEQPGFGIRTVRNGKSGIMNYDAIRKSGLCPGVSCRAFFDSNGTRGELVLNSGFDVYASVSSLYFFMKSSCSEARRSHSTVASAMS